MKGRDYKIRRGFTLVEIMIVVTIVITLVAIAIPNLLRARINSNEAAAQTTLRTISAACESYAVVNSGKFPASYNQLTDSNPKYLNEDYTSGSRQGYIFSCQDQLDNAGYNCTATPARCAFTGSKIFRITTGGILRSTSCEEDGLTDS